MTKWGKIKYQPNLSLCLTGQGVTVCPEYIELSKNTAQEGMVLLEAMEAGLITRKEIKASVKRILNTILKFD